ncbi:MAG TPA: ABC transporter substrate-binding protein [Chloroflexota bacterium]|nr:ABC transporter substrate-binding protein [Chloroflexota bacterium]
MSLTDNRDDLFKKQVSRRDALKLGGSALLGAGAGLSSLSSPAWASGAEKSATYKFGLVLPMTGSNAAFGLDQVKAALMSVDDINRSKKYGGIKVQAAVEDSQADPRVGVEAFNKVVSVAGVPVVISAWSSVIYALAPLANREKVLLISDGAADAQIAHLGHYVVSAFPLNNVDITALANYLRLELKHKKAGIIYVNNATGQFPTKVFKYVFEKAGGKVVSMQSHEPDATDFTAQLTKLRAAGPDVIHMHSLVEETPIIIKQARQLGIKAQLTSYSVAESQLVLSEDGSLADGLLYTALVPPYSEPKVATFIRALTARLRRAPNGTPYTLYLYDAPTIVAQAAAYVDKRGWKYTGTNMRRAIDEIKHFDTPLTGETTFTANGTVLKPVGIKRIEKGSFVYVTRIDPGSKLLPYDELTHTFG